MALARAACGAAGSRSVEPDPLSLMPDSRLLGFRLLHSSPPSNPGPPCWRLKLLFGRGSGVLGCVLATPQGCSDGRTMAGKQHSPRGLLASTRPLSTAREAGGLPGAFLLIYSYPRCLCSPLGEPLVVWAISVPCLRGSGSQEMLGRRLLTGLNSFLPSCLCHQPRDI